jgi:hypothetical protein
MKNILINLNACRDSIAWVEENKIETPADAWAKCERGDWMLWLADKRKLDPKKLVFLACQCARTALKYTKDERVLKCIETAEAWTRDEATIEDVKSARKNAYAAYAAYDAYAAYAAYAAATATDAAYAAARIKAIKECADIVRKHLPECP